jgi:general stress protein YciG
MDQARQKEIARMGGRAAHQQGVAHKFDSNEAREAGRRGGEAVSRNREHMAEIGARGGHHSHDHRDPAADAPAEKAAPTAQDAPSDQTEATDATANPAPREGAQDGVEDDADTRSGAPEGNRAVDAGPSEDRQSPELRRGTPGQRGRDAARKDSGPLPRTTVIR